MVYDNARINVKFNGNLLKQNKVTYNHGSIVNIYVVYRLTHKINLGGIGPTLENCLFGAVKLTKNADIDKYKYMDMVLNLIQEEVLHIHVEEKVKMLLSLELIRAVLHMLITKQETF